MKKPDSLPGFTYLGGKDRRYLNEATGQTISRRQYDKLSGKLGEFRSYEAKAKASKEANPEVFAARPARGRKVANTQTSVGKNLKSTNSSKFATHLIPIRYLANGAPNLKKLGEDFVAFIEGLKQNPRAFAVVTQIIFTKYGDEEVRTLLPAITWPTLSDLGQAIELFKMDYDFKGEDKYIALSLHVIFKADYMTTILGKRKDQR